MRKVSWDPELRNKLICQVKGGDGDWMDFASIKDGDDAHHVARYCKRGAEAFRFGRAIPASDFRVITTRGEVIELEA